PDPKPAPAPHTRSTTILSTINMSRKQLQPHCTLLADESLLYYRDHRDLHSFPTRRSSDLRTSISVLLLESPAGAAGGGGGTVGSDRKSTRLNSSHVKISNDVFCLKKKKASNPESQLIERREIDHFQRISRNMQIYKSAVQM